MVRKKIFDILPPKSPANFQTEKQFSSGEKTDFSKDFIKKRVNIKKVFIFIFFFLFFLGIFSYFTLAKVIIEIWPKTEILNFEEKVIAEANFSQIDFPSKIIPAQILEIEEEVNQEFPSSGKIEKEAEGKIRVYNKYHLPLTLKAETRFQPDSKEVLYFCSPSKIFIPAKSFVDIQVKACFVKSGEGEKYNIKPSKFSVPGLSGSELFFYVYGESFEPMKGGGKVSQVIKEDLERAKNILTQTLFTRLEESLKNNLSTDSIFLETAGKKEILDIVPEAKVGAQVESFNFLAKGRLKTIVFKKSDLENFAKGIVLTQIPKDSRFQTESLKIDFQSESIDFEKGEIILNLKFSVKIFSDFDLLALKENLTGKSLQESKMILENQTDIIKAQISAWPFWLRKIPKDVAKIEIEINIDASTEAQHQP